MVHWDWSSLLITGITAFVIIGILGIGLRWIVRLLRPVKRPDVTRLSGDVFERMPRRDGATVGVDDVVRQVRPRASPGDAVGTPAGGVG